MKIKGMEAGPVCVLEECPARGHGIFCYGDEGSLSYWKCHHFQNYLFRHGEIRISDVPDNSDLARQIKHSPNYCPSGLERFLNSRAGQTYQARMQA